MVPFPTARGFLATIPLGISLGSRCVHRLSEPGHGPVRNTSAVRDLEPGGEHRPGPAAEISMA